jgi:hypothetical protein
VYDFLDTVKRLFYPTAYLGTVAGLKCPAF